ncbi:hypothetical protein [Acinetobacter rudis]|uniref:hypothetical protein n=1 Tax=Acinetobacter rudis TaxID=632955 RepID=UPI00333EA70E
MDQDEFLIIRENTILSINNLRKYLLEQFNSETFNLIEFMKKEDSINKIEWNDIINNLEKIKILIKSHLLNQSSTEYVKFIKKNIENFSQSFNEILGLEENIYSIINSDSEKEYWTVLLKTTIYKLHYFSELAVEHAQIYINNLNRLNNEITQNHITIEELELTKKQINDAYLKLSKEKKIVENKPIMKAYSESYTMYKSTSESYRKGFFISIGLLLFVSALLIFFKTNITMFLDPNSTNTTNQSLIEFWAIKISVILVGITLISYFLKQSSHYQRLADQSHQTQTELLAYPDFMSSVSPEQSSAIKMELALKYFGRELDGSPHKDMSNLISDQMKNATELVKASAEMIKGINQPTTKPTEPSKPKDTNT